MRSRNKAKAIAYRTRAAQKKEEERIEKEQNVNIDPKRAR